MSLTKTEGNEAKPKTKHVVIKPEIALKFALQLNKTCHDYTNQLFEQLMGTKDNNEASQGMNAAAKVPNCSHQSYHTYPHTYPHFWLPNSLTLPFFISC